MPNCKKNEKFEVAKIFLSDFYKENSELLLIDNNNNPKVKPFKKVCSELEKKVEILTQNIQECCQKNNVVHCEFCSKLKQNQN